MAARDVIRARYGARLRAVQPAHVQEQGQERPGSPRVHPPDRHGARAPRSCGSSPTRRKLYDLIWKRSIASQMEAARFERTTVDVASADGQVGLRATGQVVTFDGFLKVYMEGRDDEDFDLAEDGDGGRLPQIVTGEPRRQARRHARAALHPAAAALHRGDAGQAHGGARHRPALDLRLDRLDDPGARIRPQGQEPADPRGQGPAGHRLPRRTTSAATSTTTSPPTSRRTSTASPPATRTGRRCSPASGATSPPRSARPRACASPRCSRRSTRCWSRTCSRSRRRTPSRAAARSAAPAASR